MKKKIKKTKSVVDENFNAVGKMMDKMNIRKFDSGATRDTDLNKPDYEGFLSPLVIKRFGEYMNKHRVQADGGLRDSDNWQKLFGEDHYDVCMKSMWRHLMDVWMFHRGYEGREDMEEALCALMFNSMAYLYKIELEKLNVKSQ